MMSMQQQIVELPLTPRQKERKREKKRERNRESSKHTINITLLHAPFLTYLPWSPANRITMGNDSTPALGEWEVVGWKCI